MCHVLLQQLNWYINTTDSLPYGIYKAHYIEHTPTNHNSSITLKNLPKNALVLLCLDDTWSAFARQRGYIGQGKCPNFTAPLGKHLVALGGDQVKFSQEGIFVNKQLMPMTQAADKDEHNRPLMIFHGLLSQQFLKQQLPHQYNDAQAKKLSSYENKLSVTEYEIVLKDNEALVCNFKLSSFDSRYFGPIHIQNIIATLTPIFTW